MEQFKSPAYSHVKEVSLILSHDFICSKVVIFMCFVSHWLNCFSVRLALLVLNILIICVVPIWVVEKTGSLIICLSFNQNISHKVLIFWYSCFFTWNKSLRIQCVLIICCQWIEEFNCRRIMEFVLWSYKWFLQILWFLAQSDCDSQLWCSMFFCIPLIVFLDCFIDIKWVCPAIPD
jgi:hypothetical protein